MLHVLYLQYKYIKLIYLEKKKYIERVIESKYSKEQTNNFVDN